MDITTCPQCGTPAEILWRTVLESTHGPIEHCKVMCLQRHWFLLPVSSLRDDDREAAGSSHAMPQATPWLRPARQSPRR